MEKKKILQYGLMVGTIVVLSLLMPKAIRYLSGHLVNYIIQDEQNDTMIETEPVSEPATEEQLTEASNGIYKIGDPDLYVESSNSSDASDHLEKEDGDLTTAKKYEAEAKAFDEYVSEFTPEYVESEVGIMKTFLADKEKFRQTAAAYAYAKWGTGRRIVQIEFNALSEEDDTYICMITFYHTDHPDTENGAMVFCVLRKEEGTYSFT
jgi:hypothetical protein